MPTLDWIGKKAVVNHHCQVPFHLLKKREDLSCGEPDSGNLLVQADNLLALKALLPYYAGQVKCIYIDPPYNTGNEGWVYNDNVNSPEMKAWLGKAVGKEAEDLTRHDKWLCMMYPRLSLLWQFLSEDGSIWISMDDSEIASLRCLTDEIFGRQNFIAANVWQKRYSRENREAIGDVHEYILVYAKNPEKFKLSRNLIPPNEEQAMVYKNPNNDPRGRWQSISMTAQGWRPNQMYEIVAPNGKKHLPPEGRCWSTIESEFLKLKDDGRIYFGKDGNGVPRIVRYLSDVEGFVPWTWWPHEDVGHTDEAKKEIQSILETQTAFDTPKPVRLIERIIQIASNPGDLVLDSFTGSGTTGHAVLRMNKIHSDKSPRKFILVEMDEKICQSVTAKRLEKAINGFIPCKGEAKESLGGGFSYCELGSPLFDETGQIRAEDTFHDLARHVLFTEPGNPLPENAEKNFPLLGISNGVAVYLLYNGVLKDKRPDSGNVLTVPVLHDLPPHDGPKVIYGVGCRIGAARLAQEGITFHQIPYAIKVS